MQQLCSLKNINLSFGTKKIFDNAAITVFNKNQVGLLGLNGKGKSSLFKIISDELIPDTTTPPFIFDKANPTDKFPEGFTTLCIPQEMPFIGINLAIKEYYLEFYPKLKNIHHRLQEINQKLENSEDINKNIELQKKLLDEFEHLQGWEISREYESYLKFFNHNDHNRTVDSLSGGEQKKLLLAVGLSAKARLILWDEPTNHLDIETIKMFEDEVSNSSGTFIIISHDRFLLSKVCKQIFHIRDGNIERFNGNYTEYLEFLYKEEQDRLNSLKKLKNSLKRETDWMRQGIKARGCRSKSRVENYHELMSKVKALKDKSRRELELSINTSERKTKALITFENIYFSYDEKPLLEKLAFSLHKGDKIGIIGDNGSGKSTIINLIQESITPSSGKIKRADQIIIKHFSQDKGELDLDKTPFDILGEGNDHIILPDGRQKHVASYFESFLFDRSELHRPLHTFSGGERSRLQMALNLKQSGDIWIFDEPTNDLDLETLKILEDTLTKFKGTLLLISHDRTFLSNVTNKTWLIEDNTLEQFNGGYSQVEEYLEANRIEKKLKKSLAPENSDQDLTINADENIKLNYTQKKRKDELPILIQDTEKLISQIDTIVSQLSNSSNMDNETADQLIGLAEKKDIKESKLMELYEELELLK